MRFPLSLILAIAFPASAPAVVVNIDFDKATGTTPYSGEAAAPDPAGSSAIWNSVVNDGTKDRVASTPLVDSTGALTSVTLSLGINDSHISIDGDQERGGSFDSLMSDYVYITADAPGLIVTTAGIISGLTANNAYDLYFYGQGDKFNGQTFAGQNALITIGGDSRQTGWDGIPGGDGQLDEDFEYVKFTVFADLNGKIEFSWSNVVAGVGGNVDVDLDGESSRYSALNGLQIVHNPDAVPEVSTALLGALGMLSLLRRRR